PGRQQRHPRDHAPDREHGRLHAQGGRARFAVREPRVTDFLTLTVNGLANGAILAVTALGFVLIYKATEVINFAQGQFLLVGAFMVYTANQTWGLPWPLAVAVGIGSGVLLGIAVERLILRRMIGESALSVVMVTIGLASAMSGVVLGVW